MRDIYYYTDELFEAELVKIEIEIRLFNHLREDIFTANEIFRTNIAKNIIDQMELFPIRRSNWEKISAVAENYPDKFAEAMTGFGQRLLNKAKMTIGPKKNKWVFDFNNLKQDISSGKQSNKQVRIGKLSVQDNGLEFIDVSSPQNNFRIPDYDDIHAVIWEKENKNNFIVNFKGRKMNTLLEDEKDVQDPMENL